MHSQQVFAFDYFLIAQRYVKSVCLAYDPYDFTMFLIHANRKSKSILSIPQLYKCIFFSAVEILINKVNFFFPQVQYQHVSITALFINIKYRLM